MYHERTAQSIARRRKRLITVIVVVCVVVAACLFAWNAVSVNLREQGAASIRESVLNTAMQCCAIEGAYPSSIAHLEESYGLSINHEDYLVTYEVFAGNVVPSVVVVPR